MRVQSLVQLTLEVGAKKLRIIGVLVNRGHLNTNPSPNRSCGFSEGDGNPRGGNGELFHSFDLDNIQ